MLLRSSTFKFCVDHLASQYTDAILTSKPEQREARDRFYYLHNALQEVVAQLGVYVSEAHELMSDREREDEQQEDEE